MLNRFSCAWFFVSLWTVTHKASLSIGFSKQEYWSGLPCPPLGNIPDSGIKPSSLMSPALAGRFFTTSTTWKALNSKTYYNFLLLYIYISPIYIYLSIYIYLLYIYIYISYIYIYISYIYILSPIYIYIYIYIYTHTKFFLLNFKKA